jgi:spore maturation protein CgeB
MITDAWTGIDCFFQPGKEILVARSAEEIVRFLRMTSPEEAVKIGFAMRERAMRDHTYAQRASQVSKILSQAAPRRTAVA